MADWQIMLAMVGVGAAFLVWCCCVVAGRADDAADTWTGR